MAFMSDSRVLAHIRRRVAVLAPVHVLVKFGHWSIVMKELLASALAAASLLVGYVAMTAEGSDRPSNVDPANWIQVSDTVGFVVIPEGKSGPRIASSGLLLEPAAPGYFVAKTASGWRRLVVIEPIKGPGTAG
jgi:hypothetical protein